MRNWLSEIPGSATLQDGGSVHWDRDALLRRAERIGVALLARKRPRAPVALLADNSPEWIAVDLATQLAHIPLVPLPSFFTPAQCLHATEASGVQALFCAQREHAQALGFTEEIPCDGALALYETDRERPRPELDGIQKITFTSGTTADPKGVCLGTTQQWDVARALHAGLAGLDIRRHLSLLPLAVLLENVAGAYTALLAGATHVCPSLAETGMRGSSGFDPQLCLDAIARHRAESVILLPQMLHALVAAARPRDQRLRTLKFIAVGGARTPPALLAKAREKGFPVFEGYGLSECGSVVSLNLPAADRLGSAGMPLPNRPVRIAADGEIEVGGPGIARYLGQPRAQSEWLPTGDLGHLDKDGFLYVDGRKKNVLITGFGRNVSPEWPETLLMGSGALAQAVAFGEARPYLVAAVVPASAQVDPATLHAAVEDANRMLPDYARIRRWIAVEPFSPANGLATANGRPRRDAIWQRYRTQIESLYDMTGA